MSRDSATSWDRDRSPNRSTSEQLNGLDVSFQSLLLGRTNRGIVVRDGYLPSYLAGRSASEARSFLDLLIGWHLSSGQLV